MANRRLIITFALVFALAFSLFYYVLFTTVDFGSVSTQQRTLYLNQVGIFAEKENADKICEKLEKKKMNAYQIEKNDQIYVVTSIYEDKEQTEKEGKTLTEMEMSYLTKKVTAEGREMVQAVDEKDYVKVLEAVQSDEDTGS